MVYCESPSRFQGNPPKMCAKIISSVTQIAAERSVQEIRSVQLSAETSRRASAQFFPGADGLRPEIRSESQTQVAGKIARNAASAIQPRMGKPVTGMLSSQESDAK